MKKLMLKRRGQNGNTDLLPVTVLAEIGDKVRIIRPGAIHPEIVALADTVPDESHNGSLPLRMYPTSRSALGYPR